MHRVFASRAAADHEDSRWVYSPIRSPIQPIPLMSGAEKEKATAVNHEWQTQAPASSSNAQLEGDDPSANAVVPRVRLGNLCQILYKMAQVSGTQQQRLWQEDIDAVVLKAVATTLTSFGIEEDDRRELRADFQHLRRWRRSVEQAQSYTFKALITVIVTGVVGAVWLGIKATLGK